MQKIIFHIENMSYSGVKKITHKVAKDVELVTGHQPQVSLAENMWEEINTKEIKTKEIDIKENHETVWEEIHIYVATMGKSRFLEKAEESGIVDLGELTGKRECYGWYFPKERKVSKSAATLIIAGSDKRGTIYGLFHLSELLGVSPFVDWCGIVPAHQEEIHLTEKMACISKEPSVKYRGFFINDEWPAFGNWCTHRFGGFCADCYEHIFELLLRLKGNYLWPAMWSARFADDGPGLANAELADEYGVVMGMSHHEPCLRQGEEYKYLRGKDSIYGDAWDFKANPQGITRFWEDGLKRGGKFENVITIGMRGEADTAILGKEAGLAENIHLLREVLKTQRKLIQENVPGKLSEVPKMIALYKEVEEFFYGNKDTKGLMGCSELEDVILMLCDDNYGNLRTLPTEEMRKHPGGYGMYYHFDYHGWPVSYEWINSSYLPKVWEQMTMAYDFGVKDLWIVNVGDIATQEFPLSFFLDLAYDFQKWGTGALNCTELYTRQWVQMQFGMFPEDMQEQLVAVLTGYTRIVHKRRPEAMHAGVYHPVNENESYDTLVEIQQILDLVEELYQKVTKKYAQQVAGFVALVYYPAAATLNVTKMQIMAGMNHYLAKLGAIRANAYGAAIAECMRRDQELVDLYHHMDQGRWYGMGLSQHLGFTQWNEDECQNPVVMRVFPANKPRIVVTVDGTTQHAEGSPWLSNILELNDFCDPECKEAGITLLNLSEQKADYQVTEKPEWISIHSMEGSLEGKKHDREQLRIKIHREILLEEVAAKAKTEVTTQNVIRQGQLVIGTPAGEVVVRINAYTGSLDFPQNTFLDTKGYISIEAEHYYRKQDGISRKTGKKQDETDLYFECLKGYGKTGSAMKAFPTTAYADPGHDAPYLEYRVNLRHGGRYFVELYMQPSNPVTVENRLEYALQMNEGAREIVNGIPEEYQIGDQGVIWAEGVLNQIRRQEVAVDGVEGINTIRIYPVTPGFVLEKLVIYPEGSKPAESYMGPKETYYCK